MVQSRDDQIAATLPELLAEHAETVTMTVKGGSPVSLSALVNRDLWEVVESEHSTDLIQRARVAVLKADLTDNSLTVSKHGTTLVTMKIWSTDSAAVNWTVRGFEDGPGGLIRLVCERPAKATMHATGYTLE